jgi:hypothetical protein
MKAQSFPSSPNSNLAPYNNSQPTLAIISHGVDPPISARLSETQGVSAGDCWHTV